jgi:hypothetical protein
LIVGDNGGKGTDFLSINQEKMHENGRRVIIFTLLATSFVHFVITFTAENAFCIEQFSAIFAFRIEQFSAISVYLGASGRLWRNGDGR